MTLNTDFIRAAVYWHSDFLTGHRWLGNDQDAGGLRWGPRPREYAQGNISGFKPKVMEVGDTAMIELNVSRRLQRVAIDCL